MVGVGWEGGVGEWRVHTFTHTRLPTFSHATFNRNRPHLVLQPLQSADETVERRLNGGSAFTPTTPPPLRGWGECGSERGNSAQTWREVLAGLGMLAASGFQQPESLGGGLPRMSTAQLRSCSFKILTSKTRRRESQTPGPGQARPGQV